MTNKLTAEAVISIYSSPKSVWLALTDPLLVKEYFFGSTVVSSWEKGSTITYSGSWQGKPYEDKGNIVDIVPEKLLHITYFSSLSGKEDKPENYANVIYVLKPENGHTLVTVTQDNIETDEEHQRMVSNWNQALLKLKRLVENLPGYTTV